MSQNPPFYTTHTSTSAAQHQFMFDIQIGTVLTMYKKWTTSNEWNVLQPSDQKNGLTCFYRQVGSQRSTILL